MSQICWDHTKICLTWSCVLVESVVVLKVVGQSFLCKKKEEKMGDAMGAIGEH